MGVRAANTTSFYFYENLVIMEIWGRNIFYLKRYVFPYLTTNNCPSFCLFSLTYWIISPRFPFCINNQCLHICSICNAFLFIFPLPVLGRESLISMNLGNL